MSMSVNRMLTYARSISRDIKSDTSLIRDDTLVIKQDTAQILAQISHLRAQLPQGLEEVGPNVVLERHLADLTTYAESVKSEEPEQVAPTTAVDHDENEGRRSRRRLSMSSIKRSFSRNRNITTKPEASGEAQQATYVQPGSASAVTSNSTDPERLPSRRRSITFQGRSLSLSRSPIVVTERTARTASTDNVRAESKLECVVPVRKTSQRSLIPGMFRRRSTQSISASSSPGFMPEGSVTATKNTRASISSSIATVQDGPTRSSPANKESSSQSVHSNPKDEIEDLKTTATGMATAPSGQPQPRKKILTSTGEWYFGKTVAKSSSLFSSKVVIGSKADGSETVLYIFLFSLGNSTNNTARLPLRSSAAPVLPLKARNHVWEKTLTHGWLAQHKRYGSSTILTYALSRMPCELIITGTYSSSLLMGVLCWTISSRMAVFRMKKRGFTAARLPVRSIIVTKIILFIAMLRLRACF
jgi:hypothetical protein